MTGVSELVTIARAAHELLCVDSCTITRPTRGALNTSTGAYSVSSATLYTGACRIDVMQAQDTATVPSEVEAARHTLTLPWSAASSLALAAGDLVSVTSVDPRVSAASFVVVSEVVGSTASARRYIVERAA